MLTYDHADMFTRSRILLYTSLLALLGGACFALWYWPRWELSRAIDQVVAEDAIVRAEAWQVLKDRQQTDELSRETIRRLNAPFASLGMTRKNYQVVADFYNRMRQLDAWGWGKQPLDMIEKEMHWRYLMGDRNDVELVLDEIERSPHDARLRMVSVLRSMIEHTPLADELRHRAYELSLRICDELTTFQSAVTAVRSDLPAIQRDGWLTLRWWLGPQNADWQFVEEERQSATAQIATDAMWLATSAHQDVESVLEFANMADDAGFPLAYILRAADTNDAQKAIAQLASEGDPLAIRVLRTIDPPLDELQEIVKDRIAELHIRQLAAWQLVGCGGVVGDDVAGEIFLPSETSGRGFVVAMLAERLLSRDDAVVLSRLWLRDYDDDLKCAGALLAALLDVNHNELERAFAIEDIPRVKRIMRAALFAIDPANPPADTTADHIWRSLFAKATLDPGETQFQPDDLDPNILLCLLIANEPEAFTLLTTQPDLTNTAHNVQWREWMIERFRPDWFEKAGRAVGGSERALRLHFDALRVLRLMQPDG